MNHHFISLMIALPLFGVFLQAFLPKTRGIQSEVLARWIALASSAGASVLGFVLVASMNTQMPDLQLTESFGWIGSYAISYEVGLDGLNALLVLLVAVVFPILIAAEWNQKNGARGMYALFLILQSSLAGAACAQDFFLLFFFWAVSALPFYFLIGIWGGERREAAAFNTILVSSIGNALLFTALILIYYASEPHTFSLKELAASQLGSKSFEFFGHELSVAPVAFVLMAAGLAFRAAIWPFHGWLIGAAKESPSTVFVALSGTMIPVGIYVFIRLAYSLFPETMMAAADWVVVIGALNIAVGVIAALAQKDLRLLLAYICIGEVGLVLVGVGSLSPAGAVGAVYQQLALGLGLAGFGLFAGIISDRVGHPGFETEPAKLGGIARRAPLIAVVAGVFVVSLLGFPGFGGFVSRSLMFLGSYPAYPIVLGLALVGLLLATYCLFSMYRHIFLGPDGTDSERLGDLSLRERAYLLPLVFSLLACGIYPKPLLELVRPTVLTLLSVVK